MKPFFTFLLLFSFNLTSSQVIKTKDGISLGMRSEFISSCTKSANKELITINGLEVETYNYCSCACDNLIPTLYSWELENAIKENKVAELFLEDKNLKILMSCLKDNYKLGDDFKFDYSDSSNFKLELQNKVATSFCVQEIMRNQKNTGIWTQNMAEEYCSCAVDKLFSKGYSNKEVLELQSENSPIFNEVAIPCITNVLNDKFDNISSNSYNKNDISGIDFRCTIPLIDYLGQGFKIKIIISGVAKYYLFDTGASDLIIDRETERELLLNGSLKQDNYLDKKYYTLANNQKIKAQLVNVNKVKVGGYTVNNVVIAIIEDGSLLCGKSFLDKFRKWELNKENKELILYK